MDGTIFPRLGHSGRSSASMNPRCFMHGAAAPPVRRRVTDPDRAGREKGIALLEAIIALAIVVTTIAGVAQLLAWSRRALWTTTTGTSAIVLAIQKMEQIQALTLEVDPGGGLTTDVLTTVASEPAWAGGTGLQASPGGSLDVSTPGFVDYTDARGAWSGTGAVPPPGAAFVRRWSIAPLAADPLHSLVTHVAVVPLADDQAGDRRWSGRAAYLTTIRTRSVP
jgi:hypothetical protein